MVDPLTYYAEPGPMTHAGRHQHLLEDLPLDPGQLVEIVQNLLIYDVVAAEFYDVDAPTGRGDEIHLRGVEDVVTAMLGLDDSPLAIPRPPDRRVLSRCSGYACLLVAALRAHGVPARARVGFATYFRPGSYEDHWVAEVRDQDRWRRVDPQLDEVWRARIGFEGDPSDITDDQFLTASDAWHACRRGDADPQEFGIFFDGLHGLWFVAGNLVQDLAALNKVELLPWDVWGASPGPDRDLDAGQLALFDDLADLTATPDALFEDLRERYAGDERVRVPDEVFNSLRDRTEPVVSACAS